MMTTFRISILCIGVSLSAIGQRNCDSVRGRIAERMNEILLGSGENALKEITELLDQNRDCIKHHEIPAFYTKAIGVANRNADIWLVSRLSYERILGGYTLVESLADTLAFRIEEAYPDYFRQMERAMDSVFIAEMQQNKNFQVNFEIAFTLRFMLKRDERSKFKVIQARNESKAYDSLSRQAAYVDSLNEILLGAIFDQYGFPGYKLAGTAASDAYLMMLHMSTGFQIKYIRLLQDAIDAKEIIANAEFLIDKILYRSDKHTLYNTDWARYCPVETDKTSRNVLLSFLGLKPE